MLVARKNNRVIKIPEDKVNEFKNLGYTILDENGNNLYQNTDVHEIVADLRKNNAMLRQKLFDAEQALAHCQNELDGYKKKVEKFYAGKKADKTSAKGKKALTRK